MSLYKCKYTCKFDIIPIVKTLRFVLLKLFYKDGVNLNVHETQKWFANITNDIFVERYNNGTSSSNTNNDSS